MIKRKAPTWLAALLTSTATLLFAPSGRAAEDEVEIPVEPPEKSEVTFVPLFGGDSDIGVGGGFLGSVARLAPARRPYAWRVESVALITFKPSSTGTLDIPLQDYFARITLPHLVPNRLRFEVRPSFTWLSTIKYYGLGNASKESAAPPPRYNEFERINPALRTSMRVSATKSLSFLVGATYTQNWLTVPGGSKVAEDMRSGSPAVKEILGAARPHGVLQFEYGAIYDQRDNETSTTRGMFHQASVKLSPGGPGILLPYQFGEANVTLRFFVPLGTPRVVLAVRGVGDVLFGNAPFYELARFDDQNAIGGGTGVRGVPAQRYYGKVKVFGNAEIRTELFDFQISRKTYKFGAVAFFDGGRLWADTAPHPELDGQGLGLKYGVGGGMRLQSGESFVLRADVAWSPDARPIGAYFGAGQMF